MTEGISIEIIDPAILDGEHFPRMRCVSRKDPDEDICPQLYYCIHRGEQIRPNFPVKYADDCEGKQKTCLTILKILSHTLRAVFWKNSGP